eukprot:COSAG01_NODE_41091_length_455_cov_100.589888_1_plen_36_part_10
MQLGDQGGEGASPDAQQRSSCPDGRNVAGDGGRASA